uniref:Coatomer gamma subunit n=1 Tax=Trepomonas sp. PC1 TaxID=1076344 RepID=A0A146K9T1_9EUKA|eukprot:JAP93583.1 Coatomer gamma subunit [Trepomonas sp. PC1]
MLGEKGQSIDQQRLCLSRMLLCLNQLDVQLSSKQAEDIFFAVTKTFQQQSQHVHALAIQVISRIQHLNKSSFFATRSIVQCFEKEPALQSQCDRLLGLISNQNSLADVQKCVRLSTLDPKNQRLVASAAIAAKLQKIQLEQTIIDKVGGPSGALIVDCFQADKILPQVSKSGNQYCQMQLICNIAQSQLDEKKKLQIYMQYLPATSKEAMYEKLMVYQQALQSISQLQFATIKPNLLIIFQAFALIFEECDQDFEKIAMLKQGLKIYSNALNHQANQSDVAPMNKMLLQQVQSSNQTIQTLSTIHLITSTKNPQTIVKLSTLIPSLSGELKQSALDLLQQLTSSPEVYQYLIPILQDFMMSSDQQIRKSAFQSIYQIIQKSSDQQLQNQLVLTLIENFDDQSDKEMTKQICSQLGQIKCNTLEEAKKLTMSLWQKALLDGVQVRLASIQALAKLGSQFDVVQKVLDQVVDVLDDGYVTEIAQQKQFDEIKNFNVDDILTNQEQILAGSCQIAFKKKKEPKQAQQMPEKEVKAESNLITLNKNHKKFKKTFTNNQFTLISPSSADVTVEVCKVFYFSEQNVQTMFVFNVKSEGKLSEVELSAQKEIFKGDEQIIVIKDFESIDEVQLKKLKLKYVLEDEEDEIVLQNVEAGTFDLVSKEYPEKFEELFNQEEANQQKYTLTEILTLDELFEVLQSNTGLAMVDLQLDGKKAFFWLLGSVLGAGDVFVKCECKQLKGGQGCGVKMDFRGKAGKLIQEFFE